MHKHTVLENVTINSFQLFLQTSVTSFCLRCIINSWMYPQICEIKLEIIKVQEK